MITGTTGVLLLVPVLRPASLASRRNSREFSASRATRSGSSCSSSSDASAAAALAGERPTLKTNPGAVYLRYSTSSLQPAM